MNVFKLQRCSTKNSPHIRLKKSRRSHIGGSSITDWTQTKAKRYGILLITLSISVWGLIGLSFVNLLPASLLPIWYSSFFIINLMLFVGEMVIHREIPQRNTILRLLWLPIIGISLVGSIMWTLS